MMFRRGDGETQRQMRLADTRRPEQHKTQGCRGSRPAPSSSVRIFALKRQKRFLTVTLRLAVRGGFTAGVELNLAAERARASDGKGQQIGRRDASVV